MRLCLAVLAVCLSIVFAAPSLDRELDSHWQEWKEWHKKEYHVVSFFFFFNLSVLITCHL